jgi:hypothetical protein
MVMNGDVEKTTTNDDYDDDCNDDCDGDDVAEQSMSTSFTRMACKSEEIFFFSTTFKKKKFLLFTSSTNLTARSFDHSCRKPTKMEIKK